MPVTITINVTDAVGATTSTTATATQTASAWPDASNTGVPTGTTLTNSGGFNTTANGQIIDAKNVSGIINVKHQNVTIKRTRVHNIHGGHEGNASGLKIEDCDIVGGSWNSGISLVSAANTLIQRCDISGVENGVWCEANGTIFRDNYVHGAAAPGNPDPHIDGFQIPGGGTANVQITHNNFDLGNNGTSSCITMSDATNIDITNNRINGGSHTIYFENGTTGCDVGGNTFVAFTFGWIGGTASGSQNYTNNTFAGVTYATGHP